MTNITTQSIIDTLNWIDKMKSNLNLTLLNKKQELKNLALYNEITDIEISLKELDRQEADIKETWKQILLSAWLKKFESLDWTIIQLNVTPWALIIEDESKIPKEYIKEKITTSIDKKTLKEDIKQGLLIDWVTIEKEYNLVVKSK